MACASMGALTTAVPGWAFSPPTSPSRSTAAIWLPASRRSCGALASSAKESEPSSLQFEAHHQNRCGVARSGLVGYIELAARAGLYDHVAVEAVAGGEAERCRRVPERQAGVRIGRIADVPVSVR